jgi:hypothetical protein
MRTKSKLQELIQKMLWDFLSGVSCPWTCKSVRWISDCKEYLIFQHKGHMTYIDRVSGSGYCSTYYVMYPIQVLNDQFSHDIRYCENPIQRWNSRWSAKILLEAQQIIKERK